MQNTYHRQTSVDCFQWFAKCSSIDYDEVVVTNTTYNNTAMHSANQLAKHYINYLQSTINQECDMRVGCMQIHPPTHPFFLSTPESDLLIFDATSEMLHTRRIFFTLVFFFFLCVTLNLLLYFSNLVEQISANMWCRVHVRFVV